jgi:hypothetical protein
MIVKMEDLSNYLGCVFRGLYEGIVELRHYDGYQA